MTGAMHGRRVLVVGASSGIGAAVGAAVARAGGDVTITARRADRLEALVLRGRTTTAWRSNGLSWLSGTGEGRGPALLLTHPPVRQRRAGSAADGG